MADCGHAAFRRRSQEADIIDEVSLGRRSCRQTLAAHATWDLPAFDARLDVADIVVAVDGREYSSDRLIAAIKAGKGKITPIRLLIKSGTRYREVFIDDNGGLRFPHLGNIGIEDGGLDRLLAARL